MSVPPCASSGLNFVGLDVETANSHRGSICAIGLAVVRNGALTETKSWLCRPVASVDRFDWFNVSLHGITAADVVDQPPFLECFDDALAVIGDSPVIAHNAAFDIGAIRDAYDQERRPWPHLRYGCTLVWSHRLLNLISYRLPIVADELGITLTRHHDAGADAAAAALIALSLITRQGASSLTEFASATRTTLGTVNADLWAGCRSVRDSTRPKYPLPESDANADPSHPIFGQVVIFTGALHSMTRRDAQKLVAQCGGNVGSSVTRHTTRLVVGDGFLGDTPDDFATAKAAKATKLRTAGFPIQILTEQEFIAIISGGSTLGGGRKAQSTATV